MLAKTTYSKEYIEACRSRITALVASYRSLAALLEANPSTAATAAREAFEAQFYADTVLLLELFFVHRTRALELKDGNPLNEVRMIASSIVEHGGVLAADKTIKYRPEASVLGLEIGGVIRLDEAGALRLLDAFLSDIERKFS